MKNEKKWLANAFFALLDEARKGDRQMQIATGKMEVLFLLLEHKDEVIQAANQRELTALLGLCKPEKAGFQINTNVTKVVSVLTEHGMLSKKNSKYTFATGKMPGISSKKLRWFGDALECFRTEENRSFGSAKITALFWILDNIHKIPSNLREITKNSGLSYSTITSTFKTLIDGGVLLDKGEGYGLKDGEKYVSAVSY